MTTAQYSIFIFAKLPPMPTRVAVVGTGSIGMRHIRAFREAGALPVAVPARRSRLPALRRQGLEAMAAAPADAGAAVIATDTGRHEADARAALARGLDVLVEKPLAVDSRSAKRVTAAAAKARRRAYTACVLRFAAPLARFRSLLPQIGAVHAVAAECRSHLPDWRPGRPYKKSYSARAGEGGILRDMIHEIDYAGWLFGWPKAVSGRLRNTGRLGIAAEEAAELSWIAPSGPLVTISLDCLSPAPRRRLAAWGAKGFLEWDLLAQTVTLCRAGKAPRRFSSSQTREQRLRDQARAFLGARAGRKDERLATAADGERALAVCDAARRSSARGGREEAVR